MEALKSALPEQPKSGESSLLPSQRSAGVVHECERKRL